MYGRELYPEHGENTEIPAGWAVTFTLLTLINIKSYCLTMEVTELIPAGEDFIVFGCKDPKNDMLIAHLGYFVQSDRFIYRHQSK